MIVSPKISGKCRRLAVTYGRLIFQGIGDVSVRLLETDAHLAAPPSADAAGWRDAPAGTPWGKPWGSAWFAGEYQIPVELEGRPLFVRADTDGIEAFLFVNGAPRGIFTHPRDGADIGNHHTLMAVREAQAGARLEIAVEAYAGHPCVGSQPFDTTNSQSRYPDRYPRVFGAVSVMVRRDDVMEFVFDLETVVQLVQSLPDDSFRRGRLARVLEEVYALVPQDPAVLPEGDWRPSLAAAREVMRPHLAMPAEPSAPRAGLVGHSHMDTAWMWTIDETIRKCARTYSNALNLMEQYPEFTFVQSTPFHAELMRRHHPAIFEGIKARVVEGRWEPNGGMWIECDCNLAGGEAMVRQFLKGIAWTREHFGYTPDTFWLPDTFGYSAAIPQIMRGCGLKYFLTTKLTWNDTNTFPYDTFLWRGLDGSEVLAHFNDIQCWPDPKTLRAKLHGGGAKDFRSVDNYIQHKDVNDRRLISYGMGDGGGGPQFEMIEMARRCRDLEGCPRAEHTTVSRFMQGLEASVTHPPVYAGELYVEGHRGSLTSIHAIKRGNRRAELALRDAEILGGMRGVGTDLAMLWETLLINQFHDILPGTSIPEVHDRAVAELTMIEREARAVCRSLTGPPDHDRLGVWNTLGWDRRGILALAGVPAGCAPSGLISQRVADLAGDEWLLCSGAEVPALGSLVLELTDETDAGTSPFYYDGSTLIAPGLQLAFDDGGGIISLRHGSVGHELCAPGGVLNSFLLGEDVPEAWDNWDIDEDQRLKMRRQTELLARSVVADGPLEFRLRSEYRIGRNSRLRQDLVVRVDSSLIRFETEVDWREKHALLKVAFPTSLRPSFARHEIQFGHIERPVERNHRYDTVKFEVCNHKWTDLSENRHGAAILNDGKYGISTAGGEMRPTLLKAGLHPDPRGDEGVHRFTYALLPHEGGFSAENVVRPASELNVPPCFGAAVACPSLFRVSESNLVVEAVKPAEDGRGYVIRLYEAERSSGHARISFVRRPAEVWRCNLLEEDGEAMAIDAEGVQTDFRAFEILTLRVIPST
jgi:alpha-mannosidase